MNLKENSKKKLQKTEYKQKNEQKVYQYLTTLITTLLTITSPTKAANGHIVTAAKFSNGLTIISQGTTAGRVIGSRKDKKSIKITYSAGGVINSQCPLGGNEGNKNYYILKELPDDRVYGVKDDKLLRRYILTGGSSDLGFHSDKNEEMESGSTYFDIVTFLSTPNDEYQVAVVYNQVEIAKNTQSGNRWFETDKYLDDKNYKKLIFLDQNMLVAYYSEGSGKKLQLWQFREGDPNNNQPSYKHQMSLADCNSLVNHGITTGNYPRFFLYSTDTEVVLMTYNTGSKTLSTLFTNTETGINLIAPQKGTEYFFFIKNGNKIGRLKATQTEISNIVSYSLGTPVGTDLIVLDADYTNFIILTAFRNLNADNFFMIEYCSESGYSKDANGYCVQSCAADEGLTTSNICQQCNVNVPYCTTCDDLTLTCTSCDAAYWLNSTSQCQHKCGGDNTQIVLNDNSGCFPCSSKSNCQSCTNFTDYCTTCNPNYQLNGQTKICEQAGCSAGMCMSLTNSNVCTEVSAVVPYVSNCASCSDIDNFCMSCLSTHELTGSGNSTKCEILCQPNEGRLSETNTCYLCTEIHQECQQCSNIFTDPAINGDCLLCSTGYLPNNSGTPKCKLQCTGEAQYWKSDNTCGTCIEGCEICADETGDCQTCYPTHLKILNSPPFCKVKCQAEGEYWSSPNTCNSCNYQCNICTDGTGECTQCVVGWFLTPQKTCQKICSQNEYWAPPDDCILCGVNNCQTCFNTTGKCEICNQGFFANTTGEFCQKECKIDGEYWTGQAQNNCNNCGINCVKCENSTGNCLNCTNGFALPLDSTGTISDLKNCQEIKSEIDLKEKYYTQKERSISLVFTEKVEIENFEDLKFSLILSSSTTKTEIIPKEIKLDVTEKKILAYFDFDSSQKIENGIIEITTSKTRVVKKKGTLDKFFVDFPVQIPNVNYFITKAAKSIESAGKVGSKVTTGVTVLFVFISFPLAIILIKLFQLIDFLVFINVELPLNAQKFLEIFDQNLLSVVPNLLEFDEKKIDCVPYKKLEEQEMSCSSLNSVGSQIGQVLAVFTFKGIVVLILGLLSPKKLVINKIKDIRDIAILYKEKVEQKDTVEKLGKVRRLFFKIFDKINNVMSVEFFASFVMALQLDLLLGAFVNLKYTSFKNFENSISFFIALIIVLFYIMVIIFMMFRTRQIVKFLKEKSLKIHLKSKWSKWLFINSELKEQLNMGQYLLTVQILKDFLFAPVIVLFVEHLYAQTLPILFCLIFTIIFSIKYSPLKSKLENFTLIGNDVLYFIAITLFVAYDIKRDKLTEEQRYNNFGWPIIIVLCLIIATNIIIGFIITYYSLRDFCRKFKKSDKKTVDLNDSQSTLINTNANNTRGESAIKRMIQKDTWQRQLMQRERRLMKKMNPEEMKEFIEKESIHNKKLSKRWKEKKVEKDSRSMSEIIADLKKFDSQKVDKTITLMEKERRAYFKKMNSMRNSKKKKKIGSIQKVEEDKNEKQEKIKRKKTRKRKGRGGNFVRNNEQKLSKKYQKSGDIIIEEALEEE